MKRNLLLILLLSALTFSVFAQHKDKPATHGMLLMGSETIYASHLPMFHSPHNYQIILKLKFDSEGNRKYIEDKKVHPLERVYTIEPEVFVLPEMVNTTKKFKGKIYRGHFERGGELIAEDVAVTIEQVVYYQRLPSENVRPSLLNYILFGNNKEQFMAHRITVSPDFDEVITVRMENDKTDVLRKSPYKIIQFDEADIRAPFSQKKNSAKLEKQGEIKFSDYKQLYFELGDLD